MSGLNYHHLRYFRAVAHDGNLTRAAGRLNLSQSALSAQIRKLEHQLGHALFERRGRTLQLTEAGRVALDHADAVFAAGEELIGTLRQQGRVRTAFRVGALATLSRNFQLSFLKPILGRPDVEIVLRSGSFNELMAALEAHQLDVVLTNQLLRQDSLTPVVAHRLADQNVSLVGVPGLAHEGDDLPELLRRHPIVLPSVQSSVRIDFDALVSRLGVHPLIAAEVDDMAMMRLLVREGAGLGVIPPIVVRDELASGALRELVQLQEIREQFFAVTAKRKFPNPLLGALLEPRAA
jgi:LysR family transcriptional activator of nhaA